MIRLDKMLANYGVGSRKDVKKLIRQKLVSVNGEIINNDDYKVDETIDEVMVNGELILYQKYVYIMLNKPAGYLSANEDKNDPVVFNLIDDYTKGLFCLGRLDKDTEGLLLISNDGKLAHSLMNPKKGIYKKYYVEAKSTITNDDVVLLTSGTICLDDELIAAAFVELINDKSMYLSIKEGKYHQVKRMLNACGNEVEYLKRVQIGPLNLDSQLALGEYRYLTDKEVEVLNNL